MPSLCSELKQSSTYMYIFPVKIWYISMHGVLTSLTRYYTCIMHVDIVQMTRQTFYELKQLHNNYMKIIMHLQFIHKPHWWFFNIFKYIFLLSQTYCSIYLQIHVAMFSAKQLYKHNACRLSTPSIADWSYCTAYGGDSANDKTLQ
jgi:hypothetical protein